jgi:hypothetical protein
MNLARGTLFGGARRSEELPLGFGSTVEQAIGGFRGRIRCQGYCDPVRTIDQNFTMLGRHVRCFVV